MFTSIYLVEFLIRLGAAEQMHSHVVAIEGTIKWCGFTEVPQMIPFAWAVILTQNVEGNSTVEAIMLPPLITEILSGELTFSFHCWGK